MPVKPLTLFAHLYRKERGVSSDRVLWHASALVAATKTLSGVDLGVKNQHFGGLTKMANLEQ